MGNDPVEYGHATGVGRRAGKAKIVKVPERITAVYAPVAEGVEELGDANGNVRIPQDLRKSRVNAAFKFRLTAIAE